MRLLVRSVAAATLAALVLPAAPAAAAASRPVTIEGRGFGHGRGMGQWGAKGMAVSGAGWRAIVSHYYPAAAIAQRRPGERIRALVQTSPAIVVSSARRFRIQWSDGRAVGLNDPSRRLVRVRFSAGHYLVEKAATLRGPWTRMSRSRRPVVFVRGRSPLEVLRAGGSSRIYRGTIEVRRRSGATLVAVNHLPLEEYLFGVVPREVPSTWPAAALQAQAVAARSYAAALAARSEGRAYDICPTTACQVYGGLGARASPGARAEPLERPSTTAAVLGTAGTVLVWRGAPILAEYSSSTGGMTAAGGQPYLRRVADPADRGSPHHRWTVRLDARTIEKAWPATGRLLSVTVRARDGGGEWGGRVRLLRIRGTRGTVDVAGGTFAARLGLRSRWFRVALPGARYRFAGDLGPGATGRAVAELQRRLHENGVYAAKVTGFFGEATRDALRRYQRSRGIPATGFLGPRTRARLNAEAWP